MDKQDFPFRFGIVVSGDLFYDREADARNLHFLPGATTIASALAKLVESGHVEKGASGCRVADPFHARYLRETPARVL